MENDQDRAQYEALVKGFGNAMLVTRSADGELRSRPMAVAEVDRNGDVWFVTNVDSGKISEIAGDPQVNVTMQSEGRFVSISGRAQIVRDRRRVRRMWREAWRTWFPHGADATDLVLVRIQTTGGEYWDYRGPRLRVPLLSRRREIHAKIGLSA
jgi:general stress protein 26